MQLIKKKDTRVLYDLGSASRTPRSDTCVSELLKFNKADPNLVSQIIPASEVEGLTTSRVRSEEVSDKLSFNDIMKWKSFKEKESSIQYLKTE